MKFERIKVQVKIDPIFFDIEKVAKARPNLFARFSGMHESRLIVNYAGTLHPSDELLDVYYYARGLR